MASFIVFPCWCVVLAACAAIADHIQPVTSAMKRFEEETDARWNEQ